MIDFSPNNPENSNPQLQAGLFRTLLESIEACGTRIGEYSNPSASPQRLFLSRDSERASFRCFLRAIQRTPPEAWDPAQTVGPKRIWLRFGPVEPAPMSRDIILAHDADSGLFVGLDPTAYLPAEPVRWYAYPDEAMLGFAEANGFASWNHEGYAMLAMQSQHVADYVLDSTGMHAEADDLFVLDLYRRASTMTTMPMDEINKVPESRRKEVKERIKRVLHNNFRAAVRKAYDRKCGITGIDVNCLSHAAHIYPQSEEDCSYHPSNGILLRPDIHSAFDRSILYLDYIKGKTGKHECYMLINGSSRSKMKVKGRASGIETYEKFHLQSVRLPSDPSDQPDPTMVQKAITKRRVFTN